MEQFNVILIMNINVERNTNISVTYSQDTMVNCCHTETPTWSRKFSSQDPGLRVLLQQLCGGEEVTTTMLSSSDEECLNMMDATTIIMTTYDYSP